MKTEYLFEEMNQNAAPIPKPVNVASVPQRSPFRYPGGKTWFVPSFRKWIAHLPYKPSILIEPFAGGGIITLTALFERLVAEAVMVEIDEDIAAVWKAVVDGHADWLADRILSFELTKENVTREISKQYADVKRIAFQTILKNRTLHGGILAAGSGFLKYGENGKGIRSRWYPETIARRFREMNFIRARLRFVHADGLDILQDYANRADAVFFIDPPYTAGGKRAGRRLYKYCEIDHERLFSICESLHGEFLMTYDLAEEVRSLARKHGFQMRAVSMQNTHLAEMTELVIGRDLLWMRDAPMVAERPPRYHVKARRKQKTSFRSEHRRSGEKLRIRKGKADTAKS